MAGNSVHIQAASPLAEKFAMSQLFAALQNNRFSDILGVNKPLFERRLLWVNASSRYLLPTGLEVQLPHWLIPEEESDLSFHIKQIIDLGYNTVVLASHNGVRSEKEVKKISLERLRGCLDRIRSSGLKVALEVLPPVKSIHQFDRTEAHQWITQSCLLCGNCDFLLYRQNGLSERGFVFRKKHPTELEQALEELAFFEESSKLPIL